MSGAGTEDGMGSAAAQDGTSSGWTPQEPARQQEAADRGEPGPPGLRHGPRLLAAVASVALVVGTAALVVVEDGVVDHVAAAVPAGAGVVEVGTQPGASSLGCAGGPVLTAAVEETDEEFAAEQSPTDRRLVLLADGAQGPLVVTAPVESASSTTSGTASAPATQVEPTDDGVAVVEGAGGSGGAATVSVTGPTGQAAPSLSGLSTSLTPDGDLRGLSASSCAAPTSDAWLVGGSTAAGTSTRLSLLNPGATAAEVSLGVHTPEGVVQPPGGQDVVVPPGERSEVLLDGLVEEAVEPLAVHVTSTGGSVAPSLVVSRLVGIVPRGVEVVTPAAAPALTQVVPGLATAGAGSAVLRVVAPGEETATVEVDVLADEAGAAAAAGLATSVAVPAGEVVDVPLGGVPAGAAGVVVRSDVPVTAAVVLARSAGADDPDGPADLAVAPATAPLAPGAGLALPRGDAGLGAQVLLTNAGAGQATASVVGLAADGARTDPFEVAVPARSTRTLDPAQVGEGLTGLVVVEVVVDAEAEAAAEQAAAEETEEAGGADGGADGGQGGATQDGGQPVSPAPAATGLHAALVLVAADVPGAVAVVPPSSVPAAAGSTPVLVAPPGRWP
ncbi:DUF5719 family protein [Pseudokineococcus sp. 1T1Z-3]|uniref:DUF5719 family protein n=1 Tax=Pseudokineococcus sp. 1T1Z-3 TaxID=3132745 RepID=UPI0030976ED9